MPSVATGCFLSRYITPDLDPADHILFKLQNAGRGLKCSMGFKYFSKAELLRYNCQAARLKAGLRAI